MKHVKILRQNPFPVAIATSLLGALLGSACLDQSSGITDATGAVGNPGGDGSGAATTHGGTKASAGTGNAAHGGEHDVEAGGTEGNTPTAGTGSGGTGGSTPSGGAGDELDPQGGMPGAAGGPEEPAHGVHIGHPCTFHTAAPVVEGGTAGTGGTGGAAATSNVVVQPSAFVGNYLADSAGRTLYTYGADLPGDCNTPPKSTCVADCLVSWPIFEAGARVLGAGLDDAAFGSIQREDGLWQTTYRGWPLYYYKTDLTLGQMAGQGKGKIWHVAEVVLPSVTIMKAGTLKYLADIDGHTLYVSAADQVGTAVDDPISNCSGSCLDTFEPFHEKNFSAVTILEPLDFAVFARAGAGLQLSYKGKPLYRAATDVKSGDTTGTATDGFTVAEP